MPALETLIGFFGISALLGLSPGPDNVFVMLQSAMRGRKAGFMVVLGLCTGLIGHTLAVALGLAALFAASATAFNLLKFCGAAYLLYLAWQAFRAPVGIAGSNVAASGEPLSRMYLRGIVMNLSNPKVAIFFLAFLPQFASPANGPLAPQIVALGLVFMLSTLLVFGAIAWFAAGFGQLIQRSPKAQRALNVFAGTVFIGLAARLAWAER